MRNFFIAWNFISITLILFYIVYSAQKKTRLSYCVLCMSSLVAACLLTYTLCLFTNNSLAAYILSAIYYVNDLWILYAVFIFVVSLTEITKTSRIRVFNTYTFIILAAIDSTSCIVNIFTHHAFTLTPVLLANGQIDFWRTTTHWPFFIHLALNFLMVGQNIGSLIFRSYKLPKFYRAKYMAIAILFIISVCTGVVCSLAKATFDYSLMLYVFLDSYAFYLAFFGVNRSLEDSMLSLVSENISHAVACFDNRGKCFYLNRQARGIFGYGTTGFLAAQGYRDKLRIQYPEKMFNFLKLTQTFPIGTSVHTYECEYKFLKDKKGRNVVSYIKLADTTQELAMLEQEKYRTEHDTLTGLYNRQAFFKHASEVLRVNKEIEFYLIATDIMEFKLLNSLFGEDVGDEVLKLLASTISSVQYLNTIFGRISGDKFAILIPKQYFAVETFLEYNRQLQRAVEKYNFNLQNYFGIYEIADHFENAKTMFDKALMTIDNLRGDLENTIAFYNTSLMDKQIHDKRIVSNFEEALKAGEFSMFLQPQVSAETNAVVGAEALVRWISPEKGIVPPIEFIPVLERSGLIHKLDQYMWEEAAKKLSEWKAAGIDKYISINISAKDFYYCDVFKFLTGLVEKYGIQPQKLNVEITETVLMQDVRTHREVLQRLHAAGFTIEMDDFGSGYSSLNTLKNVEMNTLKIDMGFLRESDFSQKSRDVISAIIRMSKQLGMTVISEGVETEDQTEFLKKAGCDIFQGYFFSKAISVKEFEDQYIGGGQK